MYKSVITVRLYNHTNTGTSYTELKSLISSLNLKKLRKNYLGILNMEFSLGYSTKHDLLNATQVL